MKTIFITLFDGVEGKNILRTGIFKTLFSDKDLRVIFFTKSKARAEYHKKEFDSPRIIYEVVEKIQPRGLDKFFMHLKFFLLGSETMRIRQRLLFEDRGGRLHYYFNLLVIWFLARPTFLRLGRFLDYKFVRNNTFSEFFEKYNPDLVFLANIFEETEIHLLREAKKRKVKTVALINSWDRITSKGVLRLLPDKLVVFSELLEDELVKHNLVSKKNIFIGGIPQYDFHFEGPYVSRPEFFDKLKISPDKKLLVFCPFGAKYSDSDWDILEMLNGLNRKGVFGKNVVILVRCPPNDFIDEQRLNELPGIIYEYPGVRFGNEKTPDWDMGTEELKHLSDTLHHMDILLCYASSISIDAAVCGKPVINFNFEVKRDKSLSKSPTRYYKSTHYKKALSVGGIRLVSSREELIEWVNKYLKNPELDKEKRLTLARQQCQFLDGKSGERIGVFIKTKIS